MTTKNRLSVGLRIKRSRDNHISFYVLNVTLYIVFILYHFPCCLVYKPSTAVHSTGNNATGLLLTSVKTTVRHTSISSIGAFSSSMHTKTLSWSFYSPVLYDDMLRILGKIHSSLFSVNSFIDPLFIFKKFFWSLYMYIYYLYISRLDLFI